MAPAGPSPGIETQWNPMDSISITGNRVAVGDDREIEFPTDRRGEARRRETSSSAILG